MRMTLKRAAQFAQGERIPDRAKSEMRACCIQRRRRMSFRQNKTIARRVVALRRPHIQLRAVQTGEKIGRGQTAAGVARAGVIDGRNGGCPYRLGRSRKLLDKRVMRRLYAGKG